MENIRRPQKMGWSSRFQSWPYRSLHNSLSGESGQCIVTTETRHLFFKFLILPTGNDLWGLRMFPITLITVRWKLPVRSWCRVTCVTPRSQGMKQTRTIISVQSQTQTHIASGNKCIQSNQSINAWWPCSKQTKLLLIFLVSTNSKDLLCRTPIVDYRQQLCTIVIIYLCLPIFDHTSVKTTNQGNSKKKTWTY